MGVLKNIRRLKKVQTKKVVIINNNNSKKKKSLNYSSVSDGSGYTDRHNTSAESDENLLFLASTPLFEKDMRTSSRLLSDGAPQEQQQQQQQHTAPRVPMTMTQTRTRALTQKESLGFPIHNSAIKNSAIKNHNNASINSNNVDCVVVEPFADFDNVVVNDEDWDCSSRISGISNRSENSNPSPQEQRQQQQQQQHGELIFETPTTTPIKTNPGAVESAEPPAPPSKQHHKVVLGGQHQQQAQQQERPLSSFHVVSPSATETAQNISTEGSSNSKEDKNDDDDGVRIDIIVHSTDEGTTNTERIVRILRRLDLSDDSGTEVDGVHTTTTTTTTPNTAAEDCSPRVVPFGNETNAAPKKTDADDEVIIIDTTCSADGTANAVYSEGLLAPALVSPDGKTTTAFTTIFDADLKENAGESSAPKLHGSVATASDDTTNHGTNASSSIGASASNAASSIQEKLQKVQSAVRDSCHNPCGGPLSTDAASEAATARSGASRAGSHDAATVTTSTSISRFFENTSVGVAPSSNTSDTENATTKNSNELNTSDTTYVPVLSEESACSGGVGNSCMGSTSAIRENIQDSFRQIRQEFNTFGVWSGLSSASKSIPACFQEEDSGNQEQSNPAFFMAKDASKQEQQQQPPPPLQQATPVTAVPVALVRETAAGSIHNRNNNNPDTGVHFSSSATQASI